MIPAPCVRTRLRAAALAASLVLTCSAGAGAQLISPGKLASAHADLEGIRNCTQCHQLRKQGVSEDLCLACHTPLAERMKADKGFHASLADKSCATCHKEHFGVDFALVRLDTLAWDHDRTGYGLDGSHLDVSCRACHAPVFVADPEVRAFKQERGALERTYLGLSPRCSACHESKTPHEQQFVGQACSDCHDTGAWEEAATFRHERTSFPLTGEHRTVACADCHETTPRPGGVPDLVRYEGVAHGGCNDCHADEHRGALPGACASCHTTQGWGDLDRRRLGASFDHRATGFPLEGRHAAAPCASCHDAGAIAKLPSVHVTFQAGEQGAAFPRPEAAECLSCHEDEHEGAMAPGCESCHTAARWDRVDPDRLAASFDHASTGYALEGRHAVAPCASCHDEGVAHGLEGIALTFAAGTEARVFPTPERGTCLACHQDRHAGAFVDAASGPDCRSCHGQDGWTPTAFDAARHDRETPFPLEGTHAVVACIDCHVPAGADLSFQVAGSECASCHQDADPHLDQFEGRSCDQCHRTDAFALPGFDHDRTRFPLDGEHDGAPCQACHVAETDVSGDTWVRYRPLGTECRDCHGGGS